MKENESKKCYVAFLDLLGLSNRILEEWETGIVLKQILQIKEKALEENKRKAYSFQKNYGESNGIKKDKTCEIRTISDSFVIIFEIDNTPGLDGLEKYLGLLTMFDIFKIIWKESIRNGFTIRGGMSCDFVYFNDIDVIGPALIRAYKLETHVSKMKYKK